jgi:hypothetical protein
VIADDSAATRASGAMQQSISAASVTAMGAEAVDTADLSQEPSCRSAAAWSSESVMQAAVAAVTSAEAESYSYAVRTSLFSNFL